MPKRFLKINLFIFWLHWVFVAACRLSLVVASGGFSCCGAWALGAGASVVAAHGLSSCSSRALEHVGFSSCRMWTQQLQLAGSRVQAQQLWHMGLVALRHVGSSQTRDRTCVPCIGRWILNHCTTREVPCSSLFLIYLFIYLFILFIWLCQVLVEASELLSLARGLLSCSTHVGSSSLTRDRTQALPALGAWSPSHCATRESPLTVHF